MKIKAFTAITAAFLAATLSLPLAAAEKKVVKEEKERKTVIVKDGQVLVGEGGGPFFAGNSFFQRTFIGVNLVNLSPELKTHFGAADRGTLVSTVAADSPASRAGIRVGDVITAIDGQKVSRAGDVSKAIRGKEAGDSVRVDFVRGGVAQHVFVNLAEREPLRIEAGNLVTPEMFRAREFSVESAEKLGEYFRSPEWKARLEQFQDCGRVQGRVRELETRLKELEKRLQK